MPRVVLLARTGPVDAETWLTLGGRLALSRQYPVLVWRRAILYRCTNVTFEDIEGDGIGGSPRVSGDFAASGEASGEHSFYEHPSRQEESSSLPKDVYISCNGHRHRVSHSEPCMFATTERVTSGGSWNLAAPTLNQAASI